MTRVQSYIIVGLALSVVLVCALAVALVWMRFGPNASLASVPAPTATHSPAPPPTATLLPTPTPPSTPTATRVVPASGFTDEERKYLETIKPRIVSTNHLLVGIVDLFNMAMTDSTLVYNEAWQNNLAWRALMIQWDGELLQEISPPPSMYAFHQDLLEWTTHTMNIGIAFSSFVDTDDPNFLDIATDEAHAASSFQDLMRPYPDILDFLDQQDTSFIQSATPTPGPTPTPLKCRIWSGSTYIEVDCDQY